MSKSILLAPVDEILRPQRSDNIVSSLDRWWHGWQGRVAPLRWQNRKILTGFVAQVESYHDVFSQYTNEELIRVRQKVQSALLKHGFADAVVAETFALIREVSLRTLKMKHFSVQLMGGYALLHGMIAEMETGEGKTLTATLAAATAGLAGMPVHIISVNDYLTQRDAELMGPLYQALGLTVSFVNQDVPHDERRRCYRQNIIYCTNKDVTFDYLRDRIALGQADSAMRMYAESLYSQDSRLEQIRLPGLHFAIIDEADSVLIDEAKTPLIISGTTADADEELQLLQQAFALSRSLQINEHYQVDDKKRQVSINNSGSDMLQTLVVGLDRKLGFRLRREELVMQALTAQHLYHRDQHYLVRDGKIMIIDEHTGRVMPDRAWEYGLHQMVEIKEDCEPSPPRETLAKISYQRFFQRYLHLAGMTGTVAEVRNEIWSVYGLHSVRIPTHQPSKRLYLPTRVYRNQEDKQAAVVARVQELHQQGRAILIGTASVASSEKFSEALTDAGLAHQVLNAKQDADEAGIVSQAGRPGNITIATSMAGRGTDIKLDASVKANGGLHVLITERHDAARIDRQLAGRCARQGDPGSVEMMLSLGDSLVADKRAGWHGMLARIFLKHHWSGAQWLSRLTIQWGQKRIERLHYRMRCDLLKHDQQQGELMSFSGRQE